MNDSTEIRYDSKQDHTALEAEGRQCFTIVVNRDFNLKKRQNDNKLERQKGRKEE